MTDVTAELPGELMTDVTRITLVLPAAREDELIDGAVNINV